MRFVFSVLFLFFSVAAAHSVTLTVDARSGPWEPTLNPSLFFNGYSPLSSNYVPPAFVSSADGLDFSAGSELKISYLSGKVQTNLFHPPVGPAGTFSVGGGFPGSYATGSNAFMALIAAFTDAAGVVVGVPFQVWNNPAGLGPISVFVPTGATQLQFGTNDRGMVDNLGAFVIDIENTAIVPLPASFVLLFTGIGGLGYIARRRRKTRS